MPITSPPRRVSETENMLRLLFSVDALGSLNAAQLWTFAAEQELMDYMSMRLCLHKLLETGELETGEGAMAGQLLLTDRGREAVTLFGERLPGDVRERIGAAAPAYRQQVQRSRQVQAAYEMARPRDYRLALSVREGDLPTMRLRITTGSRQLAGRAIHHFQTRAAEATTYLYALAAQALAESQQGKGPAPTDIPAQGNTAVSAPISGTAASATEHAPDAKTALEPSAAASVKPSPSKRHTPSQGHAPTNDPAPAAAPDVTEHSAGEFAVRVPLRGRRASIEAELLLPTRAAAEAFARALGGPAGGAVADKLCDILGGPVRRRKA